MRKRLAVAVALGLPVVGLHAQSAQDQAFAAFWSATSPTEAAQRAEGVSATGTSFDEAFARLKQGRTYRADVGRGIVRMSHRLGGREFAFTLDVPESYDPARRYQARVQLHGGVGRPDPTPRGTGGIGALAGDEQIYVLPAAWAEAPWWGGAQIENLRAILDTIKRIYNVDENRVALSGVSDGGTAAYYVAMRETTPFSSFLPLNGFVLVLANPSMDLREGLFPNNLRNKPFFVVNGGLDPLYPAARVEPFVKHFQQGGVETEYLPQPSAGHNTAWWPEVKSAFETFVRTHPRRPLSDTLTWETDDTEVSPRAHWLVIDRLAAGADAALPDLNDRMAGEQPNFGVRATGMRVTSVMKGSNAERIGLLPGDIVLGVNGRSIPGGVPLVDLLSVYDPKTPMTFRLSREGKPIELSGVFEPEMMPNVVPMFAHTRPSGRVDLVRDGNTVRATTSGVGAFTLLLSPDMFDLARPISVVANGRTVFNGRVTPSVRTLLKWAAQDNDRTMLFGVELPIVLP